MNRAAGQAGCTRGVRPDPLRDAIGLTMHHANIAVIDAQSFGANLRHRGLEALAQRRTAGDELDLAGGIDACLCAVGGTASTFLQKKGDPRSYGLSLRTAVF